MNTGSFIISDLHLSVDRPETVEAFKAFVEKQVFSANGLYILGDFWDYWVGDDAATAFQQTVMRLLRQIKDRGVHLYFMPGNRDFLVGKRFAAAIGAHLLKDPSVAIIEGHPLLLTHGDQLCTDDLDYQRYRRWVHRRWLQKFFLLLPRAVRSKIALKLRAQSQLNFAKSADGLSKSKINEVLAGEWCLNAQAEGVVHGHIHRLGVHQSPRRWVLGDWHDTGSCVRVTMDAIDLQMIDRKGQLSSV